MARGCNRSELWPDHGGFLCQGKESDSFFLYAQGVPPGGKYLFLHPASHELATPGATEKGRSPRDRAVCAVFLGWSLALDTRGFADLAVAMLIDVFSWGTKSSCLSYFYMRATRSLCGYEKTVETIQREETLNDSATSPKS